MFTTQNNCVIDVNGFDVNLKALKVKKKRMIYLKCQYNWNITLSYNDKIPVLFDNYIKYVPLKDVKVGQRIIIHANPVIKDVKFLSWGYFRLSKTAVRDSVRSYEAFVSIRAYDAMRLFTVCMYEGIFPILYYDPQGNTRFSFKARDVLRISKRIDLHGLMPKITQRMIYYMQQVKSAGLKYTPSAYNTEYAKISQDLILAHKIKKRPKKYSDNYWKFLGIRSLYNQTSLAKYHNGTRMISKRNQRLFRQPLRILGTMGNSNLADTESSLQAKMLVELASKQEKFFCLKIKEKEKKFTEAVEVVNPSYINGISYKSTKKYKLITLSHVKYIKKSDI